jgi:hydroxymethylbilane synthase
MSRVLRCGTRKSLLALAQSAAIAREIERRNPEVRVELVGMDTQGDRITNIPLSKIEGKEFFVAELDQALLRKETDFTVHSLKDLALDRPQGIALAAIPPRAPAQDIVVFSDRVLDRLRRGDVIRIGSSAPRRKENVPQFLERALPRLGKSMARVERVDLRGNVHSRLRKIDDLALDGAVLALAGLQRLWDDQAGQKELRERLQGKLWMVLPLSECPGAPGQGALAIECRTEDVEARRVLRSLHDPDVERSVRSERAVLAEWGGGCHQALGAYAEFDSRFGELLWVAGVKTEGNRIRELRWNLPIKPPGKPVLWDGSAWRKKMEQEIKAPTHPVSARGAVFVAHSRAAESVVDWEGARVWTSGVPSWERMAQKGIWVEGCAEGRGFAWIEPTLKQSVLQLRDWCVLTHDQALSSWTAAGVHKALSTYSLSSAINTAQQELAREALRSNGVTHIFWSSASQFELFRAEVPPAAHHACGPGKTSDRLKAWGLKPDLFPNREEWLRWLTP